MKTQLFKSIRLSEINGEVLVNLEDAAIGLGFTQSKNGKEYIRKNSVLKHLSGFGFPTSWEENIMIPESMFYILAMKANNKVAKEFQIKVATEIIPGYRKELLKIPKTYGEALQVAANQAKKLELTNKQLDVKQKELELSEEKREYLQMLHDKDWDKKDREDLVPRW